MGESGRELLVIYASEDNIAIHQVQSAPDELSRCWSNGHHIIWSSYKVA